MNCWLNNYRNHYEHCDWSKGIWSTKFHTEQHCPVKIDDSSIVWGGLCIKLISLLFFKAVFVCVQKCLCVFGCASVCACVLLCLDASVDFIKESDRKHFCCPHWSGVPGPHNAMFLLFSLHCLHCWKGPSVQLSFHCSLFNGWKVTEGECDECWGVCHVDEGQKDQQCTAKRRF